MKSGNRDLHLLLAVLSWMATSCVKVEVIEGLWSESRPVLFSILSPDTPLCVYLSHTGNVPDRDGCYPDAQLFIQEDNAWPVMLKREEGGRFVLPDTSRFSVRGGHLYTVEARLTGSLSLSARTVVPNDTAEWISASCLVSDTVFSFLTADGMSYWSLLEAEWKSDTAEVSYFLHTDKGWSFSPVYGKETCKLYVEEYPVPTAGRYISLHLWKLSPSLEDYRKTMELSALEMDNGEFFIEAVWNLFGGTPPSFSNIENGYGLFGAYTTSSRSVKILRNEVR